MEELQKDWKKHPDHAPFYRVNETIKNLNLQGNIASYFPTAGTDSSKLSTTYPGLLIGTGYSHGSGVMGEYKIGFFFDHTTGLPIIPGSSIKGMLRSAFPAKCWEKAQVATKAAKATEKEEEQEKHLAQAAMWQAEGDAKLAFLQELNANITKDKVRALELEIFEGCYAVDKHGDKLYLPLCQRDVFYDAYPVESPGGALFADDFITPHSNKGIPQPLKNPIPIQLLKVAPNVIFQFSFSLPETFRVFDEENRAGQDQKRLLAAAERQELFVEIIKTLGLGAKTNVGYGQMKTPDEAQVQGELEKLKAFREKLTTDDTKGKEGQGKAQHGGHNRPGQARNQGGQQGGNKPKPLPIPKLKDNTPRPVTQPKGNSAELPPDQYHAEVLKGKADKSGAGAEFPRLQLLPKKTEQIQPYRVKDGSLSLEDVGKILVVIPTFDERNKEQIIAFQIVNENKS
jgi:CRISPR-associated protein Cmr6